MKEQMRRTLVKNSNLNYMFPLSDRHVSSLQVTRATEVTEDPQREDPKENQVSLVYQVNDKYD